MVVGSRHVLTTTNHFNAHRWIAATITGKFKFYLVLTEPELREKVYALAEIVRRMPYIRKFIGILFSYSLVLDQGEQVIQYVKTLRNLGFEIMLDSGAFHVLGRKIPLNEYLKLLDRYIEFVNRYIYLFDWIVTMDVPCDSRPDVRVQKLSNRAKIELTIDNTLRIIDKISDPRKFMIVVQGYHPEEYAYCCELYKRYGIVTARVGVGSLCIRKYSENAVQEVKQILETVRQHLPSWVRLHAFGLNIRFLRHKEIRSLLNSSDSNSWVYPYCRFSRLVLADTTGTFIELDLKDITRRFYKIQLTTVTIYKYLILSYIEKLRTLDLV